MSGSALFSSNGHVRTRVWGRTPADTWTRQFEILRAVNELQIADMSADTAFLCPGTLRRTLTPPLGGVSALSVHQEEKKLRGCGWQ